LMQTYVRSLETSLLSRLMNVRQIPVAYLLASFAPMFKESGGLGKRIDLLPSSGNTYSVSKLIFTL
jgi:hypothetical protein